MEFVKQIIFERVLRGDFPLRERMPSERKFALEFGCSQNMIHRALQALVAEGVLVCRPSNGYFVAPANLKGASGGKKFIFLSPAKDGCSGFALALHREAKLRHSECVFRHLDRDDWMQINEIMDDRSISGMFFNCDVSYSNSWNKIFDRAYREHYPLVVLDAPMKTGALPMVGSNLFRIGFRAAELLYRYGRRALVCGYRKFEPSLRCSGFVAGCEAFNWAPPLEVYPGQESSDFSPTRRTFEEIFDRYWGEFDSIFTSTLGYTRELAEFLAGHPEIVPGRDFNWLGAENQTPVPGQKYVIDVLAQQFDLLAVSAMDMMERAMAQRGSGIITSQNVDAVYRAGNTINRNRQP
ncbi:MAG: GntR family transcriptional regulator [Lentisphaeria bacterium]|nr:GntR family transcriptional regulator [Lentisphaeria bacterium]